MMSNNSGSMFWASKLPLSVLSDSLLDFFPGGENPGSYCWNKCFVCFINSFFVAVYVVMQFKRV